MRFNLTKTSKRSIKIDIVSERLGVSKNTENQSADYAKRWANGVHSPLQLSFINGEIGLCQSTRRNLLPGSTGRGCWVDIRYGSTQVELEVCATEGWKRRLSLDDTLASYLRRYGKARSLPDARLLHAHILWHGYDGSTFLGNCLIEMYGNCGSMEDAQAVLGKIPNPNVYSWNIVIKAYAQNGSLDHANRVFCKMPQRDIVSWNAMISAFAQNGHGEEALDVFRRMQQESVKPNKVTFVSVLDSCSTLASLEEGQQIHSSIVKFGFDRDLVVATTLVNMYGKCGNLLHARRVFDRMPCRDVVCWNSMIAAFAQNGHGKEALDLFYQMQFQCIKPNRITFVCMVDACASMADLEEGKTIHAAIDKCGYGQDVVLGNALVNMYGKCGSLSNAMTAFGKMSYRDIVSWNAMITVLTQNGHGKEALDLYCQMQGEDIRPNNITFLCALDACASVAALGEGHKIHAAIVDSGYDGDIFLGNTLINMYGKCRSVCSARNLFMNMPHRNAVTWNAMVAVFAQNGHGIETLELFNLMQLEGVKTDDITFVSILDACASLKCLQMGQEIHAIAVYLGYWQDLVLGTALISMYGKCGILCKARCVFDRMPSRSVSSWNAMMAVLVQNEHGREALDLYCQMQLDGIKRDVVTFVCAIDACASLATLEEGKEIHDTIIDNGYGQDVVVGTALINMYGKCGSLFHARSVFERMPQRDIVSWNAMIAAFALNGHGRQAFNLFFQMQIAGIKPDEITFISVLAACSHTGQVEDGRQFFVSMKRDHGIPQTEDHCLCMIDLLGRAGQLDEVEDFINSMPIENAAAVWSSLLRACRIHGDKERGLHAASLCLELDPENAVTYVMLSNIHAASGGWNEVAVGGSE